MSSIKILHIADVHFGRKYNMLTPEKAEIRRSEVLLTFEDTIKRFSDAEVVLISGDLFDADCSDTTVSFVNSVFERYPDKKFFISCGNHDYYGSSAISKLLKEIPTNVTVFDTSLKSCIINDNVCIYGVSFSSSYNYVSFLRNFKADPSYTNIMVMHGDVGKDSPYNPISISEIGNSTLDYIALGHVHSYSGISKEKDTYYAYPGTLEPGGFDETDECGVIYGTVSKGMCELEFYPVSVRKYIKKEVDITGLKSDEDVILNLRSFVDENNLYSIDLVGRRSGFTPNIKLYKEMLKAFYIEINDKSLNNDSIFNYIDEYSLRGKTAKYLKELKDTSDSKAYKMACDIITDIMCKG